MNKTVVPSLDTLDRHWYVVDAENQCLGRLASEVAAVLRGKNKPTYTPHLDTGDFVVVVNADKIEMSGNKIDQKMYWWHTGHPGGIRGRTAREMLETKPEEVIKNAVKGMLPKNSLGRDMFGKLKVYATADHPHEAQKPAPLEM